LPSLRSLSLSGTPVRDPTPLGQLGQLAVVDLRGCPVSAEALARLRQALPRAEIRT
jgi:hypothetical protein